MAGDPSLLFEAIGNFVDNAIKFTPSGGRVTLRIIRANENLGVIVTDTGPGIPAEEREAVLRRFYRAERSRHTPGSGLGSASWRPWPGCTASISSSKMPSRAAA
jgi:signal transduction histidine kinase